MRGAARAGSDAPCVRCRGTRAIRTPRSIDAPSLVRVVSERPSALNTAGLNSSEVAKTTKPQPAQVVGYPFRARGTQELTVKPPRFHDPSPRKRACRFSNPEFRVLRAEGDFVAAADFPGNFFFRPLSTAKDVSCSATRRGFAQRPTRRHGNGSHRFGPDGREGRIHRHVL